MPIFYSQFLRDDNKASLAACEVSRQNVKENTPSNNGQNLRSSFKGSQRSEQEQQQPPTPPSSPSSRLVWHNHKGKSPNLKTRIISAFPFQYKDLSKKKTVHFASIEVQTYHCDHSCDEDVFIAKEQIVAMNKQRFKDASKLRKERNIKLLPSSSKNKENVINASNDDLDTSKRSHNIDRFLTEAFDPSLDTNEEVSICGIEHFVYPVLQQEMIRRRRKKSAKQEVFKFQEEKWPDPRGWRLARTSEENTLWARDVATFKGMQYSMKQKKVISFAQSHRRRASLRG